MLLVLGLAGNAWAEDALVPNPKRTPGRVARRDKDQRGVTLAMEKKVLARYRLPWSRRLEFKIDHLIPRELGGADSIDNLWPQSLITKPYGPERKDLLTQTLLARIAAGQMTLAQAQEQIRKDWIDAFIENVGMVYLR
ncbi:MAG: HNH endonuclease [Chthoniobacterales bacterium]|nr:MAG: HNH endonuclease [Chthoniobacterales bacterium]